MKPMFRAVAAISLSAAAASIASAGVVDFNDDTPGYYSDPYVFDNGYLAPVGLVANRGFTGPYVIAPVAKLFGSNPAPAGMNGNVLVTDLFFAIGALFESPVSVLSFDYAFSTQVDQFRDGPFGVKVYTYAPGVVDLGNPSGVFSYLPDSTHFPGSDGEFPSDQGFAGGQAKVGGVGPIGAMLLIADVKIDPALADSADAARGGLNSSRALLFDNLVYDSVVPLPTGATMGLAGLGLVAGVRCRR